VYPGDGDGRKKDVSASAGTDALVPRPTPYAVPAVAVSAPVTEEEGLIARCRDGEAECFRPLVQRHQRVAFSVAFRMLGGRADAEDVVQQAFVDAYAALDRFAGEGRENAFRTWLLRIVVNRCKDVLKSKKRTEEPLGADVAADDAAFAHAPADPEARVGAAEQRGLLERALARVAPKYRECLVLKDVEDLSYEEMRAILRLPITTLKIRVVRARAMLRAELEAAGYRGAFE
jgi:RNA polymerase sigma-70 factor (ECF subfamily)